MAEVRGDEERQLPIGLEVLDTQVGFVPQLVEQLHDIGRVGERRLLVGEVVDDLVVNLGLDLFQESVEGVVVARMFSARACLKSVVSACSRSVPERSSMLTFAIAVIFS